MEYIDSSNPAGGVGFGVYNNGGMKAHFDDFSVTGEDIPGNLTVSPKAKLATTWGEMK